MSCEVRPAEPGEAEALARLNLRTALAAYGHIFPPEAPAPTPAELRERWEHWLGPDHANGRRAFVAVAGGEGGEGGEVVGTVLVGPDADDPQVGHLARLNVDPDWWGQRIGTQLYDVAMASMADAGFPAATLWVLEANAKARAWYERLGWELSGERKVLFAPAGIDDVGYRIDLRRLRR